MSVQYYTVGPGVLEVGEAGSLQAFTCQVNAGTVRWSNNKADDIPVLCDEVVPGAMTFTSLLALTFVQDLADTGIIAWSMAHKGESVPIRYVPSTTVGREFTGTIQVVPVDAGGTVKTVPTSDVEWPFVGDPSLGDTPPPPGP